jgi:WD40 repeat protein
MARGDRARAQGHLVAGRYRPSPSGPSPSGPTPWRLPSLARRSPRSGFAIGSGALAGIVVLTVASGIAGCSAVFGSTPQIVHVNAPEIRGLTATLTDPDSGYAGVAADYFSQDGRTLAAVDSNGNFYLWSTTTRTVTATMALLPSQDAPGTGGTPVDLSPDDKTLAVGDEDGNTYLWNTATHTMIATLADPAAPFQQEPQLPIPSNPGPPPPGPAQGVLSVAFSPDGRTLAVADSDGFVDFYNTASADKLARPSAIASLPEAAESMAFSPDGQTLAVGDDFGDTYLLDTATRRITATLTDPDGSGGANSVAFSPDGRILAVADESGHTYLWNTATHTVTATLAEPALSTNPPLPLLTSAVFSPDGRTLVTCDDDDDAAYLWDITTHRIIATATDPRTQGINSVAFSSDGRTLATADANGSTYLWAIPKGE